MAVTTTYVDNDPLHAQAHELNIVLLDGNNDKTSCTSAQHVHVTSHDGNDNSSNKDN